MKEYWTDTILENLVPAGTDVVREGPVRIYKVDEVMEWLKKKKEYVLSEAPLGLYARQVQIDLLNELITEAVTIGN